MSRKIASVWAVAVVAVMVAACGPGASPSPSLPSPEATPAVDSAAPGSGSLAPAADEAAIAYAISQRKQFGLRSDEAWVRQVAADPRARIQLLDFLMLPEEERAFETRQASFHDMTAAVHAYADSRPDEFGGVWIDQQRHTVGTAWTTTPEVHRLAILASAGVAGPLEARLVRYSLKELRDLQDRVAADGVWMRDIGARWDGVGADEMANVTDLSISSANPLAPALILAHYGVPADMLRITSDGTGILLLERGKIEGTVVHPDGARPGKGAILAIDWKPDRAGPGSGDCGIGDMGFGVSDDGRFELPCAPGGWTITILDENHGRVPVGSGHVVVRPGKTVRLAITLEPGVELNP